MNFSQLFSPCLFGHAPYPLFIVKGKTLRHECRRCGSDLGPVLDGQRYTPRKVKKSRKKKPATLAVVIPMERQSQR